ncbi:MULTISPECIES: helix-turn-helix domain-containing protein [unclassified Streptococcus]|uniref:helix-turn-helix domain-containing protein n=1 Tax=unclassified Streptococcus TaxID=2608887 RepID=UPI00359DD477
MAEKLYVSRQTISNWERGQTYPDINSLLLIATYFDVSLDDLVKGDIDEMKHQVNQKQFKKWVFIAGISFFIFSIAYPTRFLLTGTQFTLLISLLAIPVIHAHAQIFHIWKSQDFRTYADILNFLDNKKKHEPSVRGDIWFTVKLIFSIWLIFFAGTAVSALLFW